MKTARNLIPSLAALGLVLAGPAPATQWKAVDSTHSSLTFVVKEMGVPVDGKFRHFDAALDFDPAHPAAAHAAIVLDVASIDAGSDDANGEVVGKGWFDAKDFPQARFESTAVRPAGANRYEVSGRLTIKGHTQDITVPFTFTPQGNVALVDGAFTIRRADFAVGEGAWADYATVGNEIQVRFHFQAAAGK